MSQLAKGSSNNAAWTHAKLLEVLERHGRGLEGAPDTPDPLREEEPVLASCYGASAADVQPLGASAGSRTDIFRAAGAARAITYTHEDPSFTPPPRNVSQSRGSTVVPADPHPVTIGARISVGRKHSGH